MKDLRLFWASGGAAIGIHDGNVGRPRRKVGRTRALRVLAVSCAVALAPLVVPTVASAVSIGEGNNTTGIGYEGYDHTLIFRWQTYGGSGWNKEGVTGKDTTYSSPSVAEAPGSTVIAYEGYDHSLIFRWQAYGGSTWAREVVAGSHNAYSAPSVGEGNNANGIAVEGPDHSLDYYWQTYGTAQWNEEVVAGPGSAYSAPSVANWSQGLVGGEGGTDIWVEGADHSLVQWGQNWGEGGWSDENIADAGTTYSAPSGVDRSVTDLLSGDYYSSEVAYEGPGNSLLYYWEDSNQGSGTETVAGPGTTFSAPAIGLGNNSTGITAEGPEHSLEFYWQTFGNAGWNQEPVNGSGSTYSAPSIGEGNNATSISAEGSDHSLDFYWQSYGGSSGWNEEPAAGNWTTYA